MEGEEARSGGGVRRGVREQWGRQDSLALARASCALPRGRCQAEKPRPVRALYRFSAGAHLQASLHGCQQKNDCDFRHNRFSAWRRGQDSNLR